MKKFIALTLCTALITNIGLPVYAADVSVTSEVITATAPSTFIADESQVGGGATVKLPASIDLTYDETYGAFQYKGDIYCAGSIADGNSVAVKVPKTITYTGSETAIELDAFAKIAGSNLYCFTNDDMVNNVGKQLLIQIPGADVTKADTFEGTVNFEISMAPLGMYTEVGEAPDASEYHNYPWHMSNYLSAAFDTTTKTHISLRNMKMLYQSNSNHKGVVFWQPRNDNNTVKAIEMNDSNDVITYNSYFKADGKTGCEGSSATSSLPDAPTKYNAELSRLQADKLYTWIMGFEALNSVIVPQNISYNQLHTQIYEVNYTCNWHDVDYYNHNLNDKGTPIGDAIVFVKGIDSNNNWIYVPNIVYRGTIDEWKALSANGIDWVFGNAANIVTVHCTDGKLYY